MSLGESYNLKVWLADDTKTLGEVVVSGQAGVNGTRNGAAQTISNRMIQELPSINHSVADIARVNPFVKVTEGGAINIAGSNNRYNAIQIDGAMSNDVFGLTSNGANGGQAGTQPFSMETIDQLHVSIALSMSVSLVLQVVLSTLSPSLVPTSSTEVFILTSRMATWYLTSTRSMMVQSLQTMVI